MLIRYIFACRIHICDESSSKSYDFRGKMQKKIEKWLVLVISVNFLRFSLKLLSRISEKVIKMFFRWKTRQIKQNKKFSNFLEYQLYRKAIAFDKIGSNYASSGNSTKICFIRIFLHAEFISAMKTVQNPTIFVKNAKKKKT